MRCYSVVLQVESQNRCSTPALRANESALLKSKAYESSCQSGAPILDQLPGQKVKNTRNAHASSIVQWHEPRTLYHGLNVRTTLRLAAPQGTRDANECLAPCGNQLLIYPTPRAHTSTETKEVQQVASSCHRFAIMNPEEAQNAPATTTAPSMASTRKSTRNTKVCL